MPTSSLYFKRGERRFLKIPVLSIETAAGLLLTDKQWFCLQVLLPGLAITGVLPSPARAGGHFPAAVSSRNQNGSDAMGINVSPLLPPPTPRPGREHSLIMF